MIVGELLIATADGQSSMLHAGIFTDAASISPSKYFSDKAQRCCARTYNLGNIVSEAGGTEKTTYYWVNQFGVKCQGLAIYQWCRCSATGQILFYWNYITHTATTITIPVTYQNTTIMM
jgi:hypothetical protein